MGRDSPVLQTFLPNSMHHGNPKSQQQPPFSNMTSPRLPFYDGADSTDSLPRTWRESPRSDSIMDRSSINLNSSNISSSSNNLPSSSRQQQHHSNHLQQPYVQMSSPRDRLNLQQPSGLPKLSLSARNSPRSPEPQMSRGHDSLPTSPRVPSPTPLLPPRDSIDNFNKNINHKSLLSNDHKSYRGYSQQLPDNCNKMATFLGGQDWATSSIATTEDCDDQRSTTTSGSYTIDNEEDYLALEYKPKDVVV